MPSPHNSKNPSFHRPEVLSSIVKPVDVARSAYVSSLQDLPISVAERERRIADYDQRKWERQICESYDRDDLLASKALILLADLKDHDEKSLLSKSNAADSDNLRDCLASLLLGKGQFGTHLSKSREALTKHRESVQTFLDDPVIQIIEQRQFSDEELTLALQAVGAKSEATVFEYGDESEPIDFDGVDVTMQGDVHLHMLLGLIIESRHFLQSEGPALESVLQSLERVAMLRSPSLEKRFLEDLKRYVQLIAESADDNEEASAAARLIKQSKILFKAPSQRVLARWDVTVLISAPQHLVAVVDAYEILQKSKALEFFQYYPFNDGSEIFIATALSARVAALDNLGLKLSSVLELYRSTEDIDKLELLEILNYYPRFLEVYHVLPPGFRRADFAGLILQISRLDAAVALSETKPVIGVFLSINTGGSDKLVLDVLLRAPVSFWTELGVEQVANSLLSTHEKQLAASVLVSCNDGARPNRMRLLRQLLASTTHPQMDDELLSKLKFLSQSSEANLARINNAASLPASTSTKNVRRTEEKSKSKDSGRSSDKSPSWLKEFSAAVDAGKVNGVSSELLSKAVASIPEHFRRRIGYLAALHPHALPGFLTLSSKHTLFAEMFSKDMELLVGFSEAIKASSASAVIATVEEILVEEPLNPYANFHGWLGSIGTKDVKSRALFSVSAQQMIQSPKTDRKFSRIFFIGGQHSVAAQTEISDAAPQAVEVRFYHGLNGTPLDPGALDSQTLVVSFVKSISHAIHNRVKSAVSRSGGQFCFLTKSGVDSTKEFLREIQPQ